MYPLRIQRWMIAAGALAFIALLTQAAQEVIYLDQKPNPFPHAPGLPIIHEDPFDPTRTYIDMSRLPWVLDPMTDWPDTLKESAQKPCGTLSILNARYPLWKPALAQQDPIALCAQHPDHTTRLQALRRAGWLDKLPTTQGPVTLLTSKGDLLLDRGDDWELAIVPQQGLLMRKRGTP